MQPSFRTRLANQQNRSSQSQTQNTGGYDMNLQTPTFHLAYDGYINLISRRYPVIDEVSLQTVQTSGNNISLFVIEATNVFCEAWDRYLSEGSQWQTGSGQQTLQQQDNQNRRVA